MIGRSFLALLLAAASLPAAQPSKEPRKDSPQLSEQITVTAARDETRIADTPASIAVLSREALEATAATSVDQALLQVVGFSLFRRTSSVFANPTSQGVSLRGLGASGASRALVLMDGVPLNDPFGGWVYWGRLPRLGLERLELMRGGVSDLYGTSALGGVVQAVTRTPAAGPRLQVELSGGGLGTYQGAASAGLLRGHWGARASADVFRTRGYVPVAPASRGSVDAPAASRHATADLLLERRLGVGRVFARAAGYREDRENGTPLQSNDTRLASGALGADWGASPGAWSSRLWGSSQVLRQTFSAVAQDRSAENLTRAQRVPAHALGASLQRSSVLGSRHRLLVGAEAAGVAGTTNETAYARGAASALVEAGGSVRTAALFVQDLVQARPRLLVSASARVDRWWRRRGRSRTTPLQAGTPSSRDFPDRAETAWSPRLGLLLRASRSLSLTASGYGAFRAPTLNELYRGFRVGDVQTDANPELRPERLWGGEVGALVSHAPLAVRVSAFDSTVRDAVANVTVSATPSLTTRQRRNVGRIASRGFEGEGELRLGPRVSVTAGYAFTDAHVSAFAADPGLEGRRVPQVPRHQATLQARFVSRWRASLQCRWTGAAYEDDRNQLVLGSGIQIDALVGRDLPHGLSAFLSAENLFDDRLVTARTPVPSLSPPRTVRGGIALRAF